jgi:acylphosphatase
MMAKHLYIEGLVQGVGYRASFAAQARSLNVSGWVRNRLDGAVEALIDGPDETLARLIRWAHRGPPAAQVARVTVTDANNADITPGEMKVLPTA